MSGQFRDERCAACGHGRHHHELHFPGFWAFLWQKLTGTYEEYPAHCTGRCDWCPPEEKCQRFVDRAELLQPIDQRRPGEPSDEREKSD